MKWYSTAHYPIQTWLHSDRLQIHMAALKRDKTWNYKSEHTSMHFNTVKDFMVVYCMYTIRRSTETKRDMTPAHAPRDALLINVS